METTIEKSMRYIVLQISHKRLKSDFQNNSQEFPEKHQYRIFLFNSGGLNEKNFNLKMKRI